MEEGPVFDSVCFLYHICFAVIGLEVEVEIYPLYSVQKMFGAGLNRLVKPHAQRSFHTPIQAIM